MVDEREAAGWETPSAFANLLGMDLTHWGPDVARMTAALKPEVLNRQALPHGGLHASMLDTAMGYAGCYTGDPEAPQMCVTLSLTLNYVARAASDSGGLVAEGRRTGGGKTTFFAEGALRDSTGALVATATGVFRYVSKVRSHTAS